MSWKVSVMDQRREFVALALQESANRRELCRRFGISSKTGYKWLARACGGGAQWAADRPRRPHESPGRSSAGVEAAVLAVRDRHPAWGARKIAWTLEREGIAPPAASTIHAILQRYERIKPQGRPAKATGRFEYPVPNQMWQMDFKGRTRIVGGSYVHPLTVLDDHSRYSVCLAACEDEKTQTVKGHLTQAFERYGLPDAFLVDNGSPWGGGAHTPWTPLSVWLLKLEVVVIHGRPYHPQTRGKNERFNRTIIDEVLALNLFHRLDEVQDAFDDWRLIYNTQRPHEGIGMALPASRYQPSPRRMPHKLPAIEYASHETVRVVARTKNCVSFKSRPWKVPQAFAGERVAIRPDYRHDGLFGIYFGAQKIADIDLTVEAE
jgi:transposase InsO family protein